MRKPRSFQPWLALGASLIAAFVVINAGPAFFPPAATTVRIEAVIWKIIGASLFIGSSLWAFGGREAMARGLGLTLDGRTVRWLGIGTVGGTLFVVVWFVLLRGMIRYRLEQGPMSVAELSVSVLFYSFGAVLEELAFRGYPLVRLRNRYGTWTAIISVSLAFGILHLPGMNGMRSK